MAEIKAIETRYNGYRFRSRLEARWAVFFDELHIAYEYEPEGYQLPDKTRYLPDFLLRDLPCIGGEARTCYVEIKPPRGLTDEESNKLLWLSLGANATVLLCRGDPAQEWITGCQAIDTERAWVGDVSFASIQGHGALLHRFEDAWWLKVIAQLHDKFPWSEHEVCAAAKKAREARFDGRDS